jgi:hypothetical protein
MSLARRRLNQALIAGAGALLMVAVGAASIIVDARRASVPEVSGPVLPGWSERAADAAEIEIITANARFRLVRTEAGWVMPSRGNYAVRPERIAELDSALTGLRFERAMTRDGDKYDRLNLGDPASGGAGVRLIILDEAGEPLADLVAGRQQNDGDGVYVRPSNRARAFAASGELPVLADPGVWLGLDFWSFEPSAIGRARIEPETGEAYFVQRAGLAQRNYELMEPDRWRLITGGAANGVATAGARLRFRDVKPAQALEGSFVARHVGTTFSGLVYRFDFVAEGERRWAVIRVEALADDAGPRAERLRSLTEGWAFEVSEDAYERLTRPLDQLAEPVGPVQP